MYKNRVKSLVEGIRFLEKQNASFLHLTVNENQLSKTANHFLSSKLSERYYFGSGKSGVIDFGSYTFVGMPAVEKLVLKAEKALKKMTEAKVVNLNCFSGLHAMMCAILVTTQPGDVVMSLPFEDGGHGSTKGIIESLGRKHVFAKFDLKNLNFDIVETVRIFKESKAMALYIDLSVHLNPVNIRELRNALGDKALIIFDASHSLGLILGGEFQSPFKEGADVVCGNTHKTLAGPQRGLILFKDESLGRVADWLIKTTLVSSVHLVELIALSISILEYEQYGKAYAKQVIKNSEILARAFAKLGYEVRKSNTGKYSNNEQVHVFIDALGDRMQLYKRLVRNNISTNFMQILGGRSFARLGTQEITRRGMKRKEMWQIASLVDQALRGDNVKAEVVKFNQKFRRIHYSFD
jgi:glycine/serine hydroxymethyltransferase